jgi:hypothetical protein
MARKIHRVRKRSRKERRRVMPSSGLLVEEFAIPLFNEHLPWHVRKRESRPICIGPDSCGIFI